MSGDARAACTSRKPVVAVAERISLCCVRRCGLLPRAMLPFACRLRSCRAPCHIVHLAHISLCFRLLKMWPAWLRRPAMSEVGRVARPSRKPLPRFSAGTAPLPGRPHLPTSCLPVARDVAWCCRACRCPVRAACDGVARRATSRDSRASRSGLPAPDYAARAVALRCVSEDAPAARPSRKTLSRFY